MKPGDLVITVNAEDPHLYDEDVGLHGVIVSPVTFEDGDPINRWCDWWVLVNGELQPWAKENLEVVDEAR